MEWSQLERKTQMKLIQYEDYKIVNWKNGKGQSAEIVIHPPHGNISDLSFQWRLSTARISEDSPFSVFPGYNRYLTLLSGKSIEIFLEKTAIKKTISVGQILQFSGDEPAHCHLPTGPVTDLNLIYKKSEIQSEFKIFEVTNKPRSFQVEAQTALLFVLSGEVITTVFPGEKKIKIKSQSTLLLPTKRDLEETLLLVEVPTKKSVIALIEINEKKT